jgi:DNA polymerase I-like protein with 3'-5' exonuclease and polymerase domains
MAVDLETHDPDLKEKGPGVRRGATIVGLAVATDDGFKDYYPWNDATKAWAKVELARSNQEKVGANLMYDMDFLSHHGVAVNGRLLDVQIAEPLIDENQFSYSLETLAQKYCGVGKNTDILQQWALGAGLKGKRAGIENIKDAPFEIQKAYAIGDVELPLLIIEKQLKIIEDQGLGRVFDIESRLLPMLVAMRQRGVRVDIARAIDAYDQMQDECDSLLSSVSGIDIYNTAALAKYCDDKRIEYPRTAPSKRFPAGQPSFVDAFISTSTDPTLAKVARLRKLTKTKDVFLKSYILEKVLGDRLHCEFHPLRSDEYGTVSGRFSSSNPNLQNIPNRDPVIGPLIRGIFIPDSDDHMWARWDQSQIEFRFLCHYGIGPGAEKTRQLYRDNPTVDFHSMVAELTEIERKPAKNINFGLVYGMSERKMAENLGRDIWDVKPMFDQYHERLPFVRHTYKEVARVAGARGWIKTILGRRRRFDKWGIYGMDDVYDSPQACHDALRGTKFEGGVPRRAFTHKALNALLQGSAADQMKVAMVNIWDSGLCADYGVPGLTVHDELDWSLPKYATASVQEVKRIMQEALKLNIPVVTESGTGANWNEAS